MTRLFALISACCVACAKVSVAVSSNYFGVQGLLTTASKTNGDYRYNFATVPFLAECLKLLISCWLLRRQTVKTPEV